MAVVKAGPRLFIDDHVNPGIGFTRRLRVYNTSDEPQHLRLYAGAAAIRDHRFTFAPPTAPGNELTVTNTGQRAIDIEGRLWLTGGPSKLNAGPFTITRGTTPAPADRGPITVPLGPDVPNGVWRYRLTPQSGRITRTATGAVTITDEPLGPDGWPPSRSQRPSPSRSPGPPSRRCS